jgi:hypothetical protein
VDGREHVVWRLADYHDDTGLITFHTAVFSKDAVGKWAVDVISTPQRPLFADALQEALEESGFKVAGMYGNLQGAVFERDESSDLVIMAEAA